MVGISEYCLYSKFSNTDFTQNRPNNNCVFNNSMTAFNKCPNGNLSLSLSLYQSSSQSNSVLLIIKLSNGLISGLILFVSVSFAKPASISSPPEHIHRASRRLGLPVEHRTAAPASVHRFQVHPLRNLRAIKQPSEMLRQS